MLDIFRWRAGSAGGVPGRRALTRYARNQGAQGYREIDGSLLLMFAGLFHFNPVEPPARARH